MKIVFFIFGKEKRKAHRSNRLCFQIEYSVVPVEVKAGNDGRLRSLKIFMEEKKISLGVIFSQSPLEKKRNTLNLPFYMVDQLSRIIMDAWS